MSLKSVAILRKIISGGQTGADQAGLRWAKDHGLETGGWMPRGFRTEAGQRREFARLYRMRETPEADYPPRTIANVKEADATFLFGNLDSRGSSLTARVCLRQGKPLYRIPLDRPPPAAIARAWLARHGVRTLNVAGNRESATPGIFDFAYAYLNEALGAAAAEAGNVSASRRPPPRRLFVSESGTTDTPRITPLRRQ